LKERECGASASASPSASEKQRRKGNSESSATRLCACASTAATPSTARRSAAYLASISAPAAGAARCSASTLGVSQGFQFPLPRLTGRGRSLFVLGTSDTESTLLYWEGSAETGQWYGVPRGPRPQHARPFKLSTAPYLNCLYYDFTIHLIQNIKLYVLFQISLVII
jgi:hypothetical protein